MHTFASTRRQIQAALTAGCLVRMHRLRQDRTRNVFMLKGTMCIELTCNIVPFSINTFEWNPISRICRGWAILGAARQRVRNLVFIGFEGASGSVTWVAVAVVIVWLSRFLLDSYFHSSLWILTSVCESERGVQSHFPVTNAAVLRKNAVWNLQTLPYFPKEKPNLLEKLWILSSNFSDNFVRNLI